MQSILGESLRSEIINFLVNWNAEVAADQSTIDLYEHFGFLFAEGVRGFNQFSDEELVENLRDTSRFFEDDKDSRIFDLIDYADTEIELYNLLTGSK